MSRAVLGIDAAWTLHNPSGIGLVQEGVQGWRCVALAPSYASFLALAQGTPVEWASPKFTGSEPNVAALLAAADEVASEGV